MANEMISKGTGKTDERKKALDAAIAAIEKAYGKGAIMKIGDGPVVRNVKVISTGCLTLDYALGTGGIPRGRITEIYGPESSGKTTVCLHIAAEAQKMGLNCAYIDAEQALDPVYAEALGVDVKNLIISQPDSGEQGLDIAHKLVESGCIDLIVIDSVAALTPKDEIDGNIGDAHVALQARLMSQALRKLAPLINKSETALVFINQLRDKVGSLMPGQSPETTPGGKALKFYATVRLDVRRIGSVKQGEEFTGNRTRVKVVKNKLAPPFRLAEFEIMFGRGISNEGCILDLAIAGDLVQKNGSWFSYKGERIAQGKEAIRAWLEKEEKIREEILAQVKGNLERLAGTIGTKDADDR
ncbi:MAG: recombinase RecA [Christensenellaceae bacterium]|jgi:recombination protein RecA|nr:recombinase RecA [Christensenellaceae bacterium]